MFRMLHIFKKKQPPKQKTKKEIQQKKAQEKKASHVAMRKGEIGEYKIDIQLSQFPKNYKVLSDIMVENPKSISGYSQIDHVVLTPYGLFVIETKNYQGTIYGGEQRKTWLVNGKFKMMNPLIQNYGHVQALKQCIDQKYTHAMYSLVTFTKRCTLKIGENIREISSKAMVIYDVYLTETIHRKTSLARLQHDKPIYTDEDIEHIYQKITAANITDSKKRQAHTDRIQGKKSPKKKTGNATCVICNKEVTDKVKEFCLQNNKRFNGKIYCFEHQRHI